MDNIMLEDAAERYRLLVDSITDYAIYMLDETGHVISWNPGAQRFKGYLAVEIIGKHFSRFYTDEDRAAGVPVRALETARTEGRFEAEGWRVRKNGDRFWAHVIIDAIRDPEGMVIGFAKITRDLTERRTAEEAVRRSEQQFKLLVQGVTDYAIYLLDTDGHVSSWNAGAERIKGYSAEEIIGSHFSVFYTPADREAGLPAIALKTAAAEGRFEKEGWRVRKDGEAFFAHVIIDPIRNDAGAIIGFAKITRDITERREAQERLEATRQALLHAQKMEAIGQFTGGIAHDFNNLIMAITASLELLRKRMPDDPRALMLLDNAVAGARRGADLTGRLLAFARKQELKLGPVEVAELVRSIMPMLQRVLGPAFDLRTNFDGGLDLAMSDEAQLETAVLNLVLNARDAMPHGGTISIEATSSTLSEASTDGVPAGSYVKLSVVDQGVGMDEETLARAMEPFYTTKGVGKGTGLGLSTIHGLAEQSGGKLVLSSRPGEGTRVDVWLPLAEQQSLERQARQQDEHDVGPPLRILAVEDDDLVLNNIGVMLEELGHEVQTAPSGAAALAYLATGAFDLVITDHAMPHMTGQELAGRIHAQTPEQAVLLTSGFADLAEGTKLPFLSKPYSLGDLEAAISRLRPAARAT